MISCVFVVLTFDLALSFLFYFFKAWENCDSKTLNKC